MAINSQHVTGFAIGIGVSALGFYMYKKNQSKVDQFLRDRGIKFHHFWKMTQERCQ